MNLHVHIYAKDADDPYEDKDLEVFNVYDDFDEPDMHYVQYGFEHKGEWIEIRVPMNKLVPDALEGL